MRSCSSLNSKFQYNLNNLIKFPMQIDIRTYTHTYIFSRTFQNRGNQVSCNKNI